MDRKNFGRVPELREAFISLLREDAINSAVILPSGPQALEISNALSLLYISEGDRSIESIMLSDNMCDFSCSMLEQFSLVNTEQKY